MKIKNNKFKLLTALVSTGTILSLSTIAMTSCTKEIDVPTNNNNAFASKKGSENAEYATLTFNGNGGTLTGATVIKIKKGKIFASITPPTATRDDYNFIGWYNDSTAGTVLEPTTVISESLTIYAHWEQVIHSRTLTFSAGETGATLVGPTTVQINEEQSFAEVAQPDATLANHDFKCWQYTNSEGQAEEITDESAVDYSDFVDGTNTITPVFYDPKAYSVEIVADAKTEDGNISLQDTATLSAVVHGQTGVSQTVTWSSSNPTKIAINQTSGQITLADTAEVGNTATITATSTINGQTVTATKDISVVEPWREYTDKIFVQDTSETATKGWWEVTQDSLCGSSAITVTKACQSDTRTIERNAFNNTVHIGSDITYIHDNFLNGCTAFNSSLIIHDTTPLQSHLQIVGNFFMEGCSGFAKEIIWPSSLLIIGNDFMSECSSVTKVTLPSSLISVGESFAYDCEVLTSLVVNCPGDVFQNAMFIDTLTVPSTAQAYVDGVTVTGSGAAGFIAKFPEMHGPLYRNYAE